MNNIGGICNLFIFIIAESALRWSFSLQGKVNCSISLIVMELPKVTLTINGCKYIIQNHIWSIFSISSVLKIILSSEPRTTHLWNVKLNVWPSVKSALRPPPRRKMKNPPFFREKGRRFLVVHLSRKKGGKYPKSAPQKTNKMDPQILFGRGR